jgi:ADP-heptose:LPS heptosyltransferase/glycosyltransferase involved in cell wall biosynthesis
MWLSPAGRIHRGANGFAGGVMSSSSVRVSLVVPTVNRTVELRRLLESLVEQEFKDFEALVVDQNCDDRIIPVLEPYQAQLCIYRIATPEKRGISSAKNDGWRRARGDIIVFPDDDCWYPPWFLRKGLQLLETSGAALVSGRIANECGHTINARVSHHAQFITRRTVWTTQSEAATLYRRELLERLGGFDEKLGIGSSSPWQAAEGPDLILTAIAYKFVCYYDPSLYGFHREYDLDSPAGGMLAKGRHYARGMGYVLRRHRFGLFNLLYWASRPLLTLFAAAASGRFYRAHHSLFVSVGRIEGWLGRTWAAGLPSQTTKIVTEGLITDTKLLERESTPAVGSGARFAEQLREMTGPYRARNPLLVGSLYALDSVARVLPRRQGKIAERGPLRVLVANWGHLGDVVTILPLLKFLEQHPRVEQLGVLIGSGSLPVLEASDIIAKIHVVDHWALNRSNQSTTRKIVRYHARRASLIDEIKASRYDMSIDTFATFPSTHGITWSASIPRRVGFVSGGLGALLTDAFRWVPDDKFMLDHQLELLEPILTDTSPQSLPASYPGFEGTIPAEVLGLGSVPYIVIHMGPASFRSWVWEKWVEVAETLAREGYGLVATGGTGSETEAARALQKRVSLLNLTGRLSWKQFVATVAKAAAVVTIDSVTGHVAASFGVPAVILAAGRQRLDLWRPKRPNIIMLTHTVGCAPCNRTRGCAAMACVRLIEVEEVLSSLRHVMKLSRTITSEQFMPIRTAAPN